MASTGANDVSHDDVRLWLERAKSNGPRCFICVRIAQLNELGEWPIRPIKISGIELSPETQISHLRRCVGAHGTAS